MTNKDGNVSAQVFLTSTHLAIAMEYAQGGDLFRYVLRHKGARLAEAQARWIFQQLVIGLDFCHRSVSPQTKHPPLVLPCQYVCAVRHVSKDTRQKPCS